MTYRLLFQVLLLAGISTFACAAPETVVPEGKIAQLEERAAKATTTVVAEYAKDLLDAAKASIAEAKINSAADKSRLATLQLEMADIQLNAADAKAAEKELKEKVAVRRSELKKMEASLEKFRQGEEN